MKSSIVTCLLLVGITMTAFSQQPSGRRGLDQIDLLTVQRAATQNGTPIDVDLETFQLLEPLVRYCKELERDYKTNVLDSNKPLTPESMAAVFARKADAIHRSLFLIRKIKDVSPPVAALLNETDGFGRDFTLIAVSLYDDDRADAVYDDIVRLGRKYGLGDQPDKRQLVGAVLNRLNANFTRLKLAQ
ncbi:MAG TPA: hypothetical protein VNA22_08735 [Pyrinomonadaceae bacterium]|nr:hypothetical protein [Pyrinomonadaceae bacterium]